MKECPRCGACAGDEARACPRDGGDLVERFPGEPLVDETYRLIRRIGRGGSGDVYEAEHRHLGRSVALKLLRTDVDVPERRARFAREARALGALGHPNVVAVSDSGVDARGLAYLVMERLAGRTLRDELSARGALPVEEALGRLDGIARGLDAAHEAGILHRDLKPENVFLVDGAPGADGVRLLDFGLVTSVGEASRRGAPGPASGGDAGEAPDATLTEEGMTLGTRAYLAPEMARSAEASRRSDVYALGVTAFEMLTGRRPFQGSGQALLLLHVRAEPPRPSEVRPSLPAALDDALLAALAKEPEDRPPSGAAFVRRLTAAARGARRVEAPEVLARARRAAAVATLLLGALGAATWDSGALARLDARLTTWRFSVASPRPPDPRLLLVTLDDAALAADPAPLATQADVFAERLSALLGAGAVSVAVDMLLPAAFGRSEAFSRLVLEHRDRLTLAAFSEGGAIVGPECLSPLTTAALGRDGTDALFGFVNMGDGVDGVVEDAPASWLDRAGRRRDAFALHAARRLGAVDPGRPIPIDYRVSPVDVPRISWRDVPALAVREPGRVAGRLVVVGGTFVGSGDDRYRTPALPHGRHIPGVTLQALVANTHLAGAPLRRIPVAGLLAGLTLVSGVLVDRLLRRPPAWTLAAAVAGLGIAFALSVASGLVLPLGRTCLAVGGAALLGLALRAVLRLARAVAR